MKSLMDLVLESVRVPTLLLVLHAEWSAKGIILLLLLLLKEMMRVVEMMNLGQGSLRQVLVAAPEAIRLLQTHVLPSVASRMEEGAATLAAEAGVAVPQERPWVVGSRSARWILTRTGGERTMRRVMRSVGARCTSSPKQSKKPGRGPNVRREVLEQVEHELEVSLSSHRMVAMDVVLMFRGYITVNLHDTMVKVAFLRATG